VYVKVFSETPCVCNIDIFQCWDISDAIHEYQL